MATCPNCGSALLEGAVLPRVRSVGRQPAPDPGVPDRHGRLLRRGESTELERELDPQPMQRLLARYGQAVRRALGGRGASARHGDGFMAAFGVPELHEDDALRPWCGGRRAPRRPRRAGQGGAPARGLEFHVRLGINTGNVLVRDAGTLEEELTGTAVNLAKRFEEAAGAGEILLGEETYRLVADAVKAEPAGPLAVKGAPRSRRSGGCWRSCPTARPGPAAGRAHGRPGSRAGAAAAAVPAGGRRGQLPPGHVLGSAGVGKSRLVDEFVGGLGDQAAVLRGHCPAFGDSVTCGRWSRSSARRPGSPPTSRRRTPGPSWPSWSAPRSGPRSSPSGSPSCSASAARTPGCPRAPSGRCSGCWRPSPAAGRWCWSSTTSSGPTRSCSTPSSTSPSRPTRRWCCSAWPARTSCSPAASTGRGARRTRCRSCSPPARAGGRAAGRPPARRPRRPGRPGAHQRVGPGLPAAGRGAGQQPPGRGLAAGGRRPLDPPGGVRGGGRAAGQVGADLDPRPAAGPPRPARPPRPDGDRAGGRGRPAVPPRRRRGAPSRRRPDDLDAGLELVRLDLIRADHGPTAAPLPPNSGPGYRFRHATIKTVAYERLPDDRRAELHERYADWLERETEDRRSQFDEIVGHHFYEAYRYTNGWSRAASGLPSWPGGPASATPPPGSGPPSAATRGWSRPGWAGRPACCRPTTRCGWPPCRRWPRPCRATAGSRRRPGPTRS